MGLLAVFWLKILGLKLIIVEFDTYSSIYNENN